MSKVAVVTNAFNHARYLPECIRSVQVQTFRDWQHVIINPASTDNTSEVLKHYHQQFGITVMELHTDPGLSSSRNLAIQCTGPEVEYITNLDADDLFAPTALEKMIAKAGPKTIVCPGLKEFDGGTNAGWPSGDLSYQEFQRANRVFCCSMYAKKDWEEVGGYDPALNELGFEDYCLWLDLLKNGCQVAVVPELLFYYRGDAMRGNASSAKTRDRHRERMLYLNQKHGVKI